MMHEFNMEGTAGKWHSLFSLLSPMHNEEAIEVTCMEWRVWLGQAIVLMVKAELGDRASLTGTPGGSINCQACSAGCDEVDFEKLSINTIEIQEGIPHHGSREYLGRPALQASRNTRENTVCGCSLRRLQKAVPWCTKPHD